MRWIPTSLCLLCCAACQTDRSATLAQVSQLEGRIDALRGALLVPVETLHAAPGSGPRLDAAAAELSARPAAEAAATVRANWAPRRRRAEMLLVLCRLPWDRVERLVGSGPGALLRRSTVRGELLVRDPQHPQADAEGYVRVRVIG